MTQMEHRNYFNGVSNDVINASIQNICVDKIYAGTYDFRLKLENDVFMNAHPRKSVEYLCQNLLLRKLNKNILKAYRLRVVDRKKIICQIVQLCNCKLPIQVMRKDVHHFFDSVQPKQVLTLLEKDGIVEKQTLDLCEKILKQTTVLGAPGIPKGLSISSGLTEFYMRKFDYEFQRLEGMLLYCRFVDDIICVCTGNMDLNNLQEKFKDSLSRLHLTENYSKKITLSADSIKSGTGFVYLGYELKKEDKLIVNIAEEKIKKLKTKIVVAFKQFIKDHNERLLLDRMRYLTCITTIKSSHLRDVWIGTPANYSAISIPSESLREIDTFYRSLLATKKGSFGRAFRAEMNARQILHHKLCVISFSDSFENKRKFKISPKRIHSINRCWK